VLPTPRARAETAPQREYEVKAAFVYNFLKFVVGGRFGRADGPEAAPGDPNRPIVVGVMGRVSSKAGFVELQGKLVQDRRVEVRFLPSLEDFRDAEPNLPAEYPPMGKLRECHVLFVSRSEHPYRSRFLPHLQKDGILLVGETPGFLEAGGIINLTIEEKKVRFEMNLAAAARGKLQIRSRLLRLAARTIEHDALEPSPQQAR
jgi:hypothetical protein